MTSVDKRVVQMEFDDKQFDQGADRAIKKLNSIDQSLILKNGTKGIEAAQKAVNNLKLGNAIEQAESISHRVQNVATNVKNVISNVSSGLLTFGKIGVGAVTAIAASLSALAWQGGWRRALNIEQANFQLKGLLKSEKAVEKVMQDVSYAVDGTRFGLDEAAKAAGQLSASNIKAGDDMKAALRGISGVASMTNSTYDEIAHIFTRVAGTGRMMATDLNSIAARGLNAASALAKYFNENKKAREEVIKMGLASKSNAKRVKEFANNTKLTEGNIRDLVSAGAIDFKNFSRAMDSAFGEQAKKANDTFTGALANTKAALNRIGAEIATPFIENARKVLVEVIPVINNVKKALVGMGKTTEKTFSTSGEIVPKVSTKIKNALKKQKKYVDENGFIWTKYGKQFKKQVPEDVKEGLKITTSYIDKSGNEWTKKGKKYIQTTEEMYKQTGVSVSQNIKDKLTKLNSYTDKSGNTITRLGKKYTQITKDIISGDFSSVPKEVQKSLKSTGKYIDETKTTWAKVGKSISKTTETIVSKPSKEVKKALKTVKEYTDESGATFTKVGKEYLKTTKGLITGDFSNVPKKVQKALKTASKYVDDTKTTWTKTGNSVAKTTETIVDKPSKAVQKALKKVKEYTDKYGDVYTINKKGEYVKKSNISFFNEISKAMGQARKKVIEFLNSLDAKSIVSTIRNIVKAATNIFITIKNVLGAVKNLLSPFGKALSDAFTPLKNTKNFAEFTEHLKDWSEKLKKGVKHTELYSSVIKPLAKFLGVNLKNGIEFAINAFKALGKVITFVSKNFSSFKKFAKTSVANVVKGVENLKKAFNNVASAAKKFFSPITDAISELVINAANGIQNFLVSIGVLKEGNFTNILDSITPLSNFIDLIKSNGITAAFEKWTEDILAWSESLNSGAKESSILSGVISTLKNAISFISPIFSKMSNVISLLVGKVVGLASSLSGKLAPIFSNLAPVVSSFVEKVAAFVGDKITEFFTFLSTIDFTPIIDFLSGIAEKIGEFIKSIIEGAPSFDDFINFMGGVVEVLKSLGNVVGDKASGISDFISSLTNDLSFKSLDDAAESTNDFSESVDNLKESAEGVKTFIDDEIVNPIGEMRTSIEGVSESISNTFTDSFSPEKLGILTSGLGVAAITFFTAAFIKGGADLIKSVKDISSSISSFVKSIGSLPKTFAGFQESFAKEVKYNSIVKLAAAFALLAGSVILMSTVDPARLMTSAMVLVAIQFALTKFVKAFEKIDAKTIEKSTNAIFRFTLAIGVLAIAMKIMGSMSWSDIAKGASVLIGYLTAMVLILTSTKLGKLSSNVGTQMFKLAGALVAISAVIFILGNMDAEKARTGLTRLMGVFTALAIFFGLLKKMKVTTVMVTLNGFSAALLGMVGALLILSFIPVDSMLNGARGLGIVLAELVAFSAAMKKFSDGKMAAMGPSILILSGALLVMAGVLKILSTIPFDGMVIGLLGLAGILFILTASARAMAFVAPAFYKFALAVATLSLAVIGFGVGIVSIAAGLLVLSSVVPTVEGNLDKIKNVLETLAYCGLIMIPAAIAFGVIAAGALVLSAAALIASVSILLFAASIAALAAVGPEKIVSAMQGLADGFIAMINTFGEHAPELTESFIAIFQSFLDVLGDIVPKVGLLAVDIILAILTGLMTRIGLITQAALGIITAFLQGLAAGIGPVINAAIVLALAFVQGLADGIRAHKDEFGSVLVDLLSALGEALASAVGQLLQLGADILGGIVEGIISAVGFGEAGKAAHAVLTSFVDGATSFMGDIFGLGKDTGEQVLDGVAEGAESAEDKGAEVPKNMAAGIDSAADKPVTSAENLVNDVSSTLQDGFSDENITSSADTMMSNITGSMEGGKDQIADLAESFGPTFSEGLGKGISSENLKAGLKSAVGEGIKAGKKKAEDAKGIGKKASSEAGKGASDNTKPAETGGSDVGRGLVNGIKQWLTEAGTAGYNLAAEALRRAKEALDSNSPSKEFYKLGVDVDKGLILGIQHLQSKVGDAGRDIGVEALSATNLAIKAASSMINDIDASPTIRPVVDLSGIKSGVNAANAIFANQTAWQAGLALSPVNANLQNGGNSQPTKQVNNTISINLDYKAGADANQIVRDIATGLMAQAFMEG